MEALIIKNKSLNTLIMRINKIQKEDEVLYKLSHLEKSLHNIFHDLDLESDKDIVSMSQKKNNKETKYIRDFSI